MKLFALLCLAFGGCTSLDATRGKYYTNADNALVKLDFYPSGHIKHYECAQNLHSPIVHIYGHTLTALGAEAVSYGLAGAQPALSAGNATATAIANRPTSRVPATPAPPTR